MQINLTNENPDYVAYQAAKGKRMSREEAQLMTHLQPACTIGTYTNEYQLAVETEYDGTICGSGEDGPPSVSMKATIVPAFYPDFFGYMPPRDWQPQVFAPFKFTLRTE